MSFVKIEQLHVRYGKLEAVKGISFDIPKGEVFGFIGPNGAGKSSPTSMSRATLRPCDARSATCLISSASMKT